MNKQLLSMTVLSLSTAGMASASISFTGTTPDALGTRFNYDVTAVGADYQAGDFFTIFDFLLPNAATATQPAGWTFSSALVGPVPPRLTSAGFDDALTTNLTWTYTGATTSGDPGAFSIVSLVGDTRVDLYLQGGEGGATGTASFTVVAVPEPTSIGLLAAAGLIGLRRRR